MRIFVFLVSFFLSTYIFSTNKVEEILDSAKIHYDNNRWNEAHNLINKAYDLSKKEGYFQGEIRAIHSRGWVHHKSGDLSNGVQNYFQVIQLTEDRTDSISLHFRVYAHMNLGSILEKNDFFDLSERILLNGVEVCDQLGYTSVKFRLLNNLQRTYRSAGEFLKAAEINQQILRMSERYSLENIKALNGLGIINQLQGKYDLAKYYYEKLYEESIASHRASYEAFAVHNLGDILYDQQNYSEAIKFYLESIRIREANPNATSKDKHTSHRDVSKAYSKVGRIGEALYHANQSEYYLQKIKDCSECEMRVYTQLSDLMKTKGDESLYNYYLNKLSIISERITQEQLEIKYESKQPELRQVVNEYYAELRSQQEAKASQTLLFSVIAGFVSLILILGVYHIYSRSRVRRTLTAELEKLNWD